MGDLVRQRGRAQAGMLAAVAAVMVAASALVGVCVLLTTITPPRALQLAIVHAPAADVQVGVALGFPENPDDPGVDERVATTARDATGAVAQASELLTGTFGQIPTTVTAWTSTIMQYLPVDGRPLRLAYLADPGDAAAHGSILAGRWPVSAGEVALPTSTAHALALDVGSSTTLAAAPGGPGPPGDGRGDVRAATRRRVDRGPSERSGNRTALPRLHLRLRSVRRRPGHDRRERGATAPGHLARAARHGGRDSRRRRRRRPGRRRARRGAAERAGRPRGEHRGDLAFRGHGRRRPRATRGDQLWRPVGGAPGGCPRRDDRAPGRPARRRPARPRSRPARRPRGEAEPPGRSGLPRGSGARRAVHRPGHGARPRGLPDAEQRRRPRTHRRPAGTRCCSCSPSSLRSRCRWARCWCFPGCASGPRATAARTASASWLAPVPTSCCSLSRCSRTCSCATTASPPAPRRTRCSSSVPCCACWQARQSCCACSPCSPAAGTRAPRSARSLAFPFAAWGVARRPQGAAASFLVVLATACATFGVGFGATWAQSEREQAAAGVGTDLSVPAPAEALGTGIALRAATGGRVSPATSRIVTLGSLTPRGDPVRLVAVDTRNADGLLRGGLPAGGWTDATAGLAPTDLVEGARLPGPNADLVVSGKAAGGVSIIASLSLVVQDHDGARAALPAGVAALDGAPHALSLAVPRDVQVVAVAAQLSAAGAGNSDQQSQNLFAINVTLRGATLSSGGSWTAVRPATTGLGRGLSRRGHGRRRARWGAADAPRHGVPAGLGLDRWRPHSTRVPARRRRARRGLRSGWPTSWASRSETGCSSTIGLTRCPQR